MQLGLAIAVALLILAVVAWPLAARRRGESSSVGDAAEGEAPAPGDAAAVNDVYDAIRILQTEHGMGHISDADYREQLDEYRRRAALLLRNMDDGNDVQGSGRCS